MKKTKLITLLTTFTLLFLGVSKAYAQFFIDFENGWVSSGYNDVRIPNETGTLFSLSKDLSIDSSYFFRVRAGYTFGGKHTFSLFAAPLSLEATGEIDGNIFFFEEEFAKNTPLKALYRFDSYRATYRYDFLRKPKWTVGIGFTAKIRDAEIRVEDDNKSSSKTNVGFVPLINFRVEWRFAESLSLLLNGDALASPGGQGRAEDVLLALVFRPQDNLGIRLGYRILEGGADVDEVYNFALLHFASAGVTLSF